MWSIVSCCCLWHQRYVCLSKDSLSIFLLLIIVFDNCPSTIYTTLFKIKYCLVIKPMRNFIFVLHSLDILLLIMQYTFSVCEKFFVLVRLSYFAFSSIWLASWASTIRSFLLDLRKERQRRKEEGEEKKKFNPLKLLYQDTIIITRCAGDKRKYSFFLAEMSNWLGDTFLFFTTRLASKKVNSYGSRDLRSFYFLAKFSFLFATI